MLETWLIFIVGNLNEKSEFLMEICWMIVSAGEGFCRNISAQ